MGSKHIILSLGNRTMTGLELRRRLGVLAELLLLCPALCQLRQGSAWDCQPARAGKGGGQGRDGGVPHFWLETLKNQKHYLYTVVSLKLLCTTDMAVTKIHLFPPLTPLRGRNRYSLN